MADTAIIPTNNVNGDITSCKYETVKKDVKRSGSLALKQHETFTVYDVCTKKQISEYSNSSLTFFGFTITGLLILLAVVILMGIGAVITDR